MNHVITRSNQILLLLLIIFVQISKTRVMALLRHSVSSINHRAFFDQRMHSFGLKHDTETYTGYRTSRDKKDRRVSSICTNVDRFLLVQPRSASQIRFQQDHFPTANIITVATRDAWLPFLGCSRETTIQSRRSTRRIEDKTNHRCVPVPRLFPAPVAKGLILFYFYFIRKIVNMIYITLQHINCVNRPQLI